MKKLLVISILFSALYSYSQPLIQWQKCFGGSAVDYGRSIQQTTDGGYIITGQSISTNGDVTGGHGNYDYWVVKMNSVGTLQWQKCFGGTSFDAGQVIQQTTDKGYIIAGNSMSNDGDVSGNHGGDDCWIVKIDSLGVIQWQRCLGGTASDDVNYIQQTLDGGYVIAGISNSNDGDVSGNHGSYDVWVAKLSNLGLIQWQRSLGGTLDDYGYSIHQTTNEEYIVAGASKSSDGDVSTNHGLFDYWIVQLNNTGQIQWQTSLGGTNFDVPQSVEQTTDGGYIIAGRSKSNDVDVTVNHGLNDYWLVKLTGLGILQWQKSFGGTDEDYGTCVQQTTDGGYVVAGCSKSSDVDVTGNHGNNDYWLIKLDNAGIMEWQKSLGGTGADLGGVVIKQAADHGYIVSGYAFSNDGDVTGNHGDYDYWVVKLDTALISVGVQENENVRSSSVLVSPNPSRGQFNFTGLEKESTITIYDIMGRSIAETLSNNSGKTIDLTGKDKGIYFYKIVNSKKIIQQGKLIIE